MPAQRAERAVLRGVIGPGRDERHQIRRVNTEQRLLGQLEKRGASAHSHPGNRVGTRVTACVRHRFPGCRDSHGRAPAAPERIASPGMYAITVREPGGPEMLEWSEVPDPVAGAGDVLIDV